MHPDAWVDHPVEDVDNEVYEDEDDDWEEKPLINVVSEAELRDIINESDVILNF